MKLLVMSDSHNALNPVLEIVEQNKVLVDCFIHLGDGVKEFIEAMHKFECRHYYYIAGNHDGFGFYSQSPDFRIIPFGGHRVLLTHGDKFDNKLDLLGVAHIAKMNNADVALCGHTHIAADEMINGIRVINPGALRYSRDGSPKYAVISIEQDIKVEFAEYIKEEQKAL